MHCCYCCCCCFLRLWQELGRKKGRRPASLPGAKDGRKKELPRLRPYEREGRTKSAQRTSRSPLACHSIAGSKKWFEPQYMIIIRDTRGENFCVSSDCGQTGVDRRATASVLSCPRRRKKSACCPRRKREKVICLFFPERATERPHAHTRTHTHSGFSSPFTSIG